MVAGQAEDLVQETLVRALAALDQFAPGTRMKSWLFTIMRNTFFTNTFRSRREGPGLADCVANRMSVEPPQEWNIRRKEVSAAIRQLPTAQRELLVLVTIQGGSFLVAAEVFGCNIGTVKSRLNRARNALLDIMGEPSSLHMLETPVHISRHAPGEHKVF